MTDTLDLDAIAEDYGVDRDVVEHVVSYTGYDYGLIIRQLTKLTLIYDVTTMADMKEIAR